MMKWVWLIMVVVLAALQYRFWFGQTSAEEIAALKSDIEQQQEVNASLERRNQHRIVEVRELQDGAEGIEAMAREEMGMIKQGETYFLFVPEAAASSAPASEAW